MYQPPGGLSTRQKPPFTFKSPLFAPKRTCGPEARALHGKSIGGEGILPGDPAGLPQNGAGRSGARPGAPASKNPCSRRKNGLPARSKKRSMPHDFSVQCPCLRAGQGLKSNRLHTYLTKSEGGQNPSFFFLTVPARRANKMEGWGREAASLVVHFLKECCHAGPILGKRD
jgi:hypothetical protein